MSTIKLIGIDIAKSVFHLIGVNRAGKPKLRKMLKRRQLTAFIAQLPSCTIVMEACSGANHWARTFTQHGHKIQLVAPQHVKPFVRGNKNDFNDALAITVAAQIEGMNFVTAKTVHQQDMQMLHRLRSRTVGNRTSLSNQIRGLLHEYGIVIEKGINHIRSQLPSILEDAENGLTFIARQYFDRLYQEFLQMDQQLSYFDKEIELSNKHQPECKRLMSVPGIGDKTANALYALVGDAKEFKNGRHLSAYLGLVPKQYSSGGKQTLLGISKRGNSYLRTLLIHGARAVLRYAERKSDSFSQWANSLKDRRGFNKACVAIANKMARIAWVILNKQESYRQPE